MGRLILQLPQFFSPLPAEVDLCAGDGYKYWSEFNPEMLTEFVHHVLQFRGEI